MDWQKMSFMYYKNLEEKILKDCLKIKEGEKILLCSNEFAVNLIDCLVDKIKKLKASEEIITWSDASIIEIMKNNGGQKAGEKIMPRYRKQSFCFSDEKIRADKIIIISPPIDSNNNFINNTEELIFFKETYISNLFQLLRKNVCGIILEYPFNKSLSSLYNGKELKFLAEIYRKSIILNFDKISEINNRLYPVLKKGKEVLIISPYGSELRFSIKGRKVCKEEGRIGFETGLCQLPGGEVFIAPQEESGNGIYVNDIASYGLKVGMKFSGGILIDSYGKDKEEKKKSEIIIELLRLKGERLCEFGIGTNPVAPPLPSGLSIAEKSLGTIHIAVGENRPYGGKNTSKIHYDFVSTGNNVFIDNIKIMENGRLLI